MFEQKRAYWRSLDNAAKLFSAASSPKDTRVFRFYCELKEEVEERPAGGTGSDNREISGIPVGHEKRPVLALSGEKRIKTDSKNRIQRTMQQSVCTG